MPDTNTQNQATSEVQSQDNANQIVIDVENSLYAKHFEGNQLIHNKEFESIKNAIGNRISEIGDNTSGINDSEERRSEAYTVFGTRGSGKSSFLYSLMHWCRNDEQRGKIQVLDLIDPTLFEDKGHILLTIIAQLRRLVDDAHNDRIVRTYECDYKEWHKKFESLARGIPSIKDEGFIKDNWSEPGFVMNQGVQNVYSAYTLEKNFNDFVKCSLKFLNKKLLVIIFDDIDIDFRKGWEVLETVRKYLTSRQVFVIISGDAKLFSKSIRKVQWKNFGKALLKNEADTEEEQKEAYNNLVTEMESQYMQKVMPTQYRIYLRSLLDIVGNVSNSVMVGAENIRTYYNKNLFQGYEPVNPVQTKVFADFLLSLPLRTQMQLMAAFGDTDNQPRNLVMPFVSHLLDNGINYEDLLRFPNKLNAIILKFLVSNMIVEESYQLQPNTLDADINACLVALSLVSSRYYKRSAYSLFDYIVRVGYLRFVKYSVFPLVERYSRMYNRSFFEIEKFVKHTQLYNDIDLKVSIGNAIAYLDGLKYRRITKIYGFAEKSKEGGDAKRIDNIFTEDKSLERALGFLPLTISAHTDKQSSELNYSVVALLAAITDIVREAGQKPEIENYLDESGDIDVAKVINSDRGHTIIEFLNYLSQTRNYIIPAEGQSVGEMTEGNDVNVFSIDEGEEELKIFIIELSKWIDEYKGIVLPPYLLGKIATRAFASIDSSDVSKDVNLGEAIHRRIVILLNAILVEEAREYGYNLNNNNPSGSDDIFVANLKKFKVINGSESTGFDVNKLLLFNWIVKCPLLLAYMNLPAEGELTNIFVKLNATTIINIYNYLENVEVKGSAGSPAPLISSAAQVASSPNTPTNDVPMNNEMNFRAYDVNCYNIIKDNFDTPNDLFGNSDNEQVRIKLLPFFHLVKRQSVQIFRELHGNKEVW